MNDLNRAMKLAQENQLAIGRFLVEEMEIEYSISGAQHSNLDAARRQTLHSFDEEFMAEHQNPCAICQQIERAKRGEHEGFIVETETGIMVLGETQLFRGYCVLLCKTPATELHELPRAMKLKFLEEMSLLAQAIQNVTKCHKLNYEMLGNVVHHLHFHVFPRQIDEENALKPVWNFIPTGDDAKKFAPNTVRDATLIAELRTELENLLSHPAQK